MGPVSSLTLDQQAHAMGPPGPFGLPGLPPVIRATGVGGVGLIWR